VACKGLDAQVARPEDPELLNLLGEFVPLRILNVKGVNLDFFRFDYDLTFSVLMLDAEGGVYSRFGTRDAKSHSDRMSIPGLKTAMREVLAQHRAAPPPSPQPAAKGTTVEDIPAFRKSKASGSECYHCHFVSAFRLRELRAKGEFRKELVYRYPYPENVGLTLELDPNNRVKSVRPDSPAAKAGVLPGDRILKADAVPVLTTADLQFALDPLPEEGQVTLVVERAGARKDPLVLRLPAGWRKSDVGWRASMEAVPPIVGIWGETLKPASRTKRELPEDRLALRVTFLFPGKGWDETRGSLAMGDIILGLDGERLPDLDVRQFHAHFRLKKSVGDRAVLNVLRGKEKLDIPVPCLEVEGE
jgi:hypothetical protein